MYHILIKLWNALIIAEGDKIPCIECIRHFWNIINYGYKSWIDENPLEYKSIIETVPNRNIKYTIVSVMYITKYLNEGNISKYTNIKFNDNDYDDTYKKFNKLIDEYLPTFTSRYEYLYPHTVFEK